MTATNLPALIQGADGVFRADSRDVARDFGKAHKNVLQVIDRLIALDTGARLKFQPSSYLAENGKMERCFLMDEATFSVLIPKLSGKLPLEWLIKYTQAFAAMKAHIQSVGAPAKPLLSPIEQAEANLIGWKKAEEQRLIFKAEADKEREHRIIETVRADTQEGLNGNIRTTEVGKRIHQAIGDHPLNLTKFNSFITSTKGEFLFVRGHIDGNPVIEAHSKYDTWYFIKRPTNSWEGSRGETADVLVTPIGLSGFTNMVIRDKHRILPIYRSAYQGTTVRLITGGRA